MLEYICKLGVSLGFYRIYRKEFLLKLSALLFLALVSLFFINIAHAATLTWDGGGGADTNWSTCTNWTTDTCPVSGDTVVFDGTSDNNSTVDAGFAGTITT